MRLRFLAAALLVALCGCSSEESADAKPTPSPQAENASGPKFEKRKLAFGPKEITVEIADDDERRTHGLMFRKSMPEDQGMLFIFESEQQLRFWMKNTYLPLSIAYISEKKKIVDIQDMEPASPMETSPRTYPSRAPAMYALEMNKGWFSKNKVKVGDTFVLR